MRWMVRCSGLLAVVGMALAAPAAAQDWSMSVDFPLKDGTTPYLKQNENGKSVETKFETIDVEGAILNVTTPFHVGFGIESYTVKFLPQAGDTKFVLALEVQMLDVYVELPIVSWLFIAPGAGWGTVAVRADGNIPDFQPPEDTNVWQWYAVLGARLPFGLQARLGYHEVRGTIVNRERSSTSVSVDTNLLKLTTTTIGIGYTF